MSIANYSELKSAIADWLHRTDATAVIPTWITLAESRINADLDAAKQDTAVTLTTTAGSADLDLPDDLIRIKSISVDAYPKRVMSFVTLDQLSAIYASEESGIPNYFAMANGGLVLAPIPDSAYDVSLTYKAKVPALSDSETTNWLLTANPNVYLFAALIESAQYFHGDERLPVWESRYATAIAGINAQDWYRGSTMRVKVDHPIY